MKGIKLEPGEEFTIFNTQNDLLALNIIECIGYNSNEGMMILKHNSVKKILKESITFVKGYYPVYTIIDEENKKIRCYVLYNNIYVPPLTRVLLVRREKRIIRTKYTIERELQIEGHGFVLSPVVNIGKKPYLVTSIVILDKIGNRNYQFEYIGNVMIIPKWDYKKILKKLGLEYDNKYLILEIVE